MKKLCIIRFNHIDISLRIDNTTGVMEMKVDNNAAKVNGFSNLEDLKSEIAQATPKLDVPEWIRIDNCGSPAIEFLKTKLMCNKSYNRCQ
jgi:hypothetical protein